MTDRRTQDEGMTPEQMARLVAAVDDLFVDGIGQQADRLVLWDDTRQRDLGGWCRGAIVDRLAATVADALTTERTRREEAVKERDAAELLASDLEKQFDRAEADNRRLREALARFGRHAIGCRSQWRAATGSSDIGPCDCGLSAALATPPTPAQKETR